VGGYDSQEARCTLAVCRPEIADVRVAREAKGFGWKNGAEDGIRTRDPLLGKEVLYH
jgi:hypothetical protein